MAKELAIIDKKLLTEVEKTFKADAAKSEALRDVAVSSELIPATVKVNITDRILTELERQADGLKINGLEDKEGFKKVQALRKTAKKIRTAGVAVTKAGRANAVEIQKAWLKVENDFETRVLKTEDALEKEEKEYLQLEEADKQRRINEQTIAYTGRITQLAEFNVLFDQTANTFTLGEVVYDGAIIRETDDEIFASIVEDYKAEHNKLHEAETKAAEQAKVKKESDLRFIRTTLLTAINAPAGDDTDLGKMETEDWDALYDAKKSEFDAEQKRLDEEKKRLAKEKLDARIDVLREIGFFQDRMKLVYIKDTIEKLSVLETEISALDDVDFKKLYSNLSERIVEIDNEHEAELAIKRKKQDEDVRIKAIADTRMGLLKAIGTTYGQDDLGTMNEDEWNSRYILAKERYDLRQREIKAEELKTQSDGQQWKHFISELSNVEIPEAKGKAYKAKTDAAKSLINQIKNL